MIKDNREYIQVLEKEGQLKRVKAEVDWELELGAVSRKSIDEHGPALLFENIKGYPRGFPVFANIMTAAKPVLQARIALALSMPKDSHPLEIVDEYARRAAGKPVKPRIVKTGPCKENILKGKDIDLFMFPTPRIHGIDGGRYIGTWHADITKDPASDWVNWGMYRHVIHDKKRLGTYMSYTSHGMSHFFKNEAEGKDTPTAIAIGADPISTLVSTTDLPAGISEVEVAGAIGGEPIEMVKCETVDLYVPATSEIVIEGFIRAREMMEEGPFGEYTGYSAGGRLPRPYIDVTCVTFRNNPILTITNMGKPYEEYNTITSITTSAQIANELRARAIPFKSVYSPVHFAGIVISAKMQYPGFAQTLASAVWSSRAGAWGTYVILVGDDIDPSNIEDVMWCLTTRMHPKNGLVVVPNAPLDALAAYLAPVERRGTDYFTGYHVLFNATFPMEWPKEETPVIMDWEHGWPADVRQKVLSKWKEYGIS
ncbi:MAG: UbiD family decarboxylase [Chloroflexi bacterium]|nr:UbiD family decarboxylase [Chloroflexota bacterium]